jgi:hypothetical protein
MSVAGIHTSAHVSHEARLVKSLADDAIEDGAHAAKRAVMAAAWITGRFLSSKGSAL